MRVYKNRITLNNNARGVYSLDPSMGCYSGTKNNSKGCYSDCYAARSAKKYGYDFSKTVLRYFEDEKHLASIIRKVNKIPASFIRMGTNGDPSENWEHTIDVVKKLGLINKEIVIITKHFNSLSYKNLNDLKRYNVCINTSVSALDDPTDLAHRLNEYNRLKPYCKSILRIVSCDFNKENKKGLELSKVQDELFLNKSVIDTVFRVYKNSKYVTEGVINIHKTKFLGKKCYVSKFNKKTYFGKCSSCLEQCGASML